MKNPSHPTSLTVRGLAGASLASVGMLVTASANAEPSLALDRMSVSAGAFRADPKFNASLNTALGTFQSGDIKSGAVTMPRLKMDFLIFDSQGLSFDYYQYKRGYSGAVAAAPTASGSPAATLGTASVDLKLDFGKLSYRWWFGSGDTVFGLGAGGAYYKASVNAAATAVVNGTGAGFSDGYSDNAVAPLLEVGIRHAISPDLRLFLDASGVKKSGGKLQGEIYNAAVGVEWFPVKNVGVVLDYSLSRVDLNQKDSDEAHFKMNLNGPSAFVKVRF